MPRLTKKQLVEKGEELGLKLSLDMTSKEMESLIKGVKDNPVEELKSENEEVPQLEVKEEKSSSEGKKAKKDINLQFRKGDFVPKEVIEKWKSMDLNISEFF